MNKLAKPSDKNVMALSPLQIYLKEVSKYPLLTPEEEYELAKNHFETGDTTTAHRLITSNLRLVVKIANDFRKIRGELLDLIQEGNTGLMQAVRLYNPYKGVRLSSYAVWWIRAYILKFLLENEKQVKIATTTAQRKLFYNLRQETKKLLEEYERVDTKLIAQRLNVPERDVIEMQKRMSAKDLRLDAPLSQDSTRTTTAGDMLADQQQLPMDSWIAHLQIKSIFQNHLEEFAKTLESRDLVILRSRILSDSPLTLQQLGDKFHVTRERARQLENKIINRLRVYLHKQGFLDKETLDKASKKPKSRRSQRQSTPLKSQVPTVPT